VAKGITLTLTNSINSDRNKNQNLSCHSDDSKKITIITGPSYFTCVRIYTRSSSENHTQMHGKLNGLTSLHKIRHVTSRCWE
jgi:hypothetical protein